MINFKKKKMKLLTKEQQQKAKIWKRINSEKCLEINMPTIKNIIKLHIITIMQVNMEVLCIGYVI